MPIILLPIVALLTASCPQQVLRYATHCSKPPAQWGTAEDGIGHLNHAIPIIVSKQATLVWGEHEVTDKELHKALIEFGQMLPHPLIALDADPEAPCERVIKVRNMMNSLLHCNEELNSCSEGDDPRNWERGTGIIIAF